MTKVRIKKNKINILVTFPILFFMGFATIAVIVAWTISPDAIVAFLTAILAFFLAFTVWSICQEETWEYAELYEVEDK